jgi:hypothetical protein
MILLPASMQTCDVVQLEPSKQKVGMQPNGKKCFHSKSIFSPMISKLCDLISLRFMKKIYHFQKNHVKKLSLQTYKTVWGNNVDWTNVDKHFTNRGDKGQQGPQGLVRSG